ncbi:hypothetical protein QJS10_CPA06g02115 [Acorus calamus]|uniref:Uncharacterized protein n=1 Tax=Acorus calamus TaxID=4465 RepID=A0AAV9EHU0_ACOCL|nr:hypothetical protein QJS10_CPA06g02115 [Acorus calamus]
MFLELQRLIVSSFGLSLVFYFGLPQEGIELPTYKNLTMGLSSTTTVGEGIQLCVFDMTRGQHEGQEHDKILLPPFIAAVCDWTQRRTHYIYEEPSEGVSYPFGFFIIDIGYDVHVVDKNKESEAVWRCDALQAVLKEAHSLFLMFHGSVRNLLEKQPGGGLARTHLERGTVQMLTIGRDVAIEVQDDTVNLFTYALLRLTPHALSSGTNSWSYLRRGTGGSNIAADSFLAKNGSTLGELQYTSHDTSPGRQDPRHNALRPLQRDKWSKGRDGFLVTDIWGSEAGGMVPITPTIWLQQTEEHSSSTVAFMYLSTVSVMASQKILKVEQRLTKGWGGENAYHVSGYRYLLLDSDRNISRASPPGKVTTLTKESLHALNKLREEVDIEKSRAKSDFPDSDKDLEVCIRAKNNAWAIARITRGKELYMVLEKASETLLYASDAVEKFSDRYCDGAFSLD